MLKISLDEGQIFDILSIYSVKIHVTTGEIQLKNINNYLNLKNEIIEQIGGKKYSEIIESEEYSLLYKANKNTFKMVELAQKDNGLAKKIDSTNHERFTAKVKLQKKFFNCNVNEVKIGYSQ